MIPASLLIALSLLTQLPVAQRLPSTAYNPENIRKSVLWYPLTGGILALLILAVAALSSGFLAPPLLAIVLLVCWVLSNGAIHLDGVADCTDAAAAGHADTEKILTIFKTPDVGAMAVVTLILLLMTKAILLFTLTQTPLLSASLLTAIVWSRSLTALYMLNTPYARKRGLGIDLCGSGLGRPFLIQLTVLAVGFLFIGPALRFMTALLVSGLFIMLWRRFWLRRIHGYVGDCAGASIEWIELICLFVYAL